MDVINIKKQNSSKLIKEQLSLFWTAPDQSYFSQDTVAVIINCSKKTLENDRWRGKGIPYRKCGGRVLYRKADVVAWLESHALVTSTAEYRCGGECHAGGR